MSDIGRTEPLPTDAGATRATAGTKLHDDLSVDRSTASERSIDLREEARGSDAPNEGLRDPIEAAQRPDNRAKLLLATAAMTLLNLLLLIGVLASLAGGPDFERVAVDGQQCVIELGAGEDSTLYCQR